MLIGYARTSTQEQKAGLNGQIEELKALGCDEIFTEQVSSLDQREKLDEAIRFARKGDVLVVTKLDRLARSVPHLCRIIEALEAKGVGIRIVAMGIDSTTATGKLMLNVVGAIAQFEREMMLERQQIGIAAARDAKKFKGRVPTARRQSERVMQLLATGMPKAQVMKELKISRASLYRIVQEQTADA